MYYPTIYIKDHNFFSKQGNSPLDRYWSPVVKLYLNHTSIPPPTLPGVNFSACVCACVCVLVDAACLTASDEKRGTRTRKKNNGSLYLTLANLQLVHNI